MAKAAHHDVSAGQERKRGDRRRSETVLFLALNAAPAFWAAYGGPLRTEIGGFKPLGEYGRKAET